MGFDGGKMLARIDLKRSRIRRHARVVRAGITELAARGLHGDG